jgi:hypothetical protein
MLTLMRSALSSGGFTFVAAFVVLALPSESWAQQKHKFLAERSADTSEYTQQLRINVPDVAGHQIRVYELRRCPEKC